MYFQDAGSPAAKTIVLLHGGGLSSRMWQPQIKKLAERYHVLAPDLPEHGQSRDITPFRLEDATQRVADLIRTHSTNGKAHIAGLSLGGPVVLNLLRTAPELVDHALVTGGAAKLDRFVGRLSIYMLWMIKFYSPQSLVNTMMKQQGIPEEYRSLFEQDLIHSTGEAFNRTLLTELMDMQLPEKIHKPLLVCVGQNETFTAKSQAKKLLRLYPSAMGVEIRGVGHVWNLQQPELFTRVLQNWVEDRSLPSELKRLLA